MTIALRARPRARRTALDCSKRGTLEAAVTAPAEDGRANAAVIALLAAEWHLPKSSFDVARGMSARDKVLSISGEPAALANLVAQWMRKNA